MKLCLLTLVLLTSCVHPMVDRPQPSVWWIPPEANDADLLCYHTLAQPYPCQTVADAKLFLRSLKAEP